MHLFVNKITPPPRKFSLKTHFNSGEFCKHFRKKVLA